jgi:3-phenylpropionate/trans-cinnamate dioxygenase ferredoxin subunit
LNYSNTDPSKLEFFSVGIIEDIPDGKRILISIGESPIVVFNIGGEFYAIADICSHDDGPFGDGDLEGFDIICPRHGARFDIKTGKVLSLPAVVDIPVYPVRIQNGEVQVGLPSGI